MRRITSVILLFAFLVVQYARHISYLQCQAQKYFATSSVNCDCTKAFAASKDPVASNESFPVHSHIQLEENYCIFIVQYLELWHISLLAGFHDLYTATLAPGVIDEVVKPPQSI